MGVSACDTAGFLQVVVDAVDSLVNDCPEDEEGLENNDGDAEATESKCDGTFKALEEKLETLLQGEFALMILWCVLCRKCNVTNCDCPQMELVGPLT